ncbi:hypothetical protein KJ966_08290 [bacterium]|nr:hypothetical protein [bacterium]
MIHYETLKISHFSAGGNIQTSILYQSRNFILYLQGLKGLVFCIGKDERIVEIRGRVIRNRQPKAALMAYQSVLLNGG